MPITKDRLDLLSQAALNCHLISSTHVLVLIDEINRLNSQLEILKTGLKSDNNKRILLKKVNSKRKSK